MIFIRVCYILALLSAAASVPVEIERREGSSIPPAIITQDTYKAAVYNHYPVGGFRSYETFVSTRTKALGVMSPNLNVFERQAEIAGQQSVDILVFPEEGIIGGLWNLANLDAFVEVVPDPKNVTWNPCVQPTAYNDTEVQQRLSCMARNNSLYIVASLAAKEPCTPFVEICRSSGYFTLNTNVVYDPTGVLIARYQQSNLVSYKYSFATPYDPTTFDTPFGRFAVITSYDSLLDKPAIDLIERYNVDSVTCSPFTLSMDPLLSPIQWQSAFATGTKVNFLSAGLVYLGGSGIYTPTGPASYVHTYASAQLVTATIPSRPVAFSTSQNTEVLTDVTSDHDMFQAEILGDNYNFVQLEGANGTATVCNGTFCCQAEFSRRVQDGELFVLGAFSGRHTLYAYTDLQVCALLKCQTNSTSSCVARDSLDRTAHTQFTSLVLKGNFNTKYVFPEILLSESYFEVLPGQEWAFSKNAIRSDNGFSDPLFSAILIGRDYNRDNLFGP